jgi:micrococcal nuclease
MISLRLACRAALLLSLAISLGACRRETTACLDYTPAAGNCYDTEISLDDTRVTALDPAVLPVQATACHAPVLVRITHVRDGDTVDVEGVSDTSFSGGVRLIGVDSPEIEHPPEPEDCFGNEAHIFTQQLDERLVWLTFDGDCLDPFDRWLAYVWVGGGTGDLWQRQLLRRGFARVLTIAPNIGNAPMFVDDEESALSADRGLWSACAP